MMTNIQSVYVNALLLAKNTSQKWTSQTAQICILWFCFVSDLVNFIRPLCITFNKNLSLYLLNTMECLFKDTLVTITYYTKFVFCLLLSLCWLWPNYLRENLLPKLCMLQMSINCRNESQKIWDRSS